MNGQVTNKAMRDIVVLLCCSISCPAFLTSHFVCVCVCVCVRVYARMRGREMGGGVQQSMLGGGGGFEAGSHSSHLKSLSAIKGILFQETWRRGKGFTLLRRHTEADIPT